jgi:hypothetical protein
MAARGPTRTAGTARAAGFLLACCIALPVAASGSDLPAPGTSETAAPRTEAPAYSRYRVPIYGIAGFNLLLHAADRLFFGDDFDVNRSTIRRNWRAGFSEDESTFTINQLGHSYPGGI